jgi:GTP-dependent phosphoenolpyruvate carboxykinase
LEWILKRCEVKDDTYAVRSPIGIHPTKDAIRLDGLDKIDMEALFSTPKNFWLEECKELRSYFISQVGDSMPAEILKELDDLEARIKVLQS